MFSPRAKTAVALALKWGEIAPEGAYWRLFGAPKVGSRNRWLAVLEFPALSTADQPPSDKTAVLGDRI